MPHCDLYVSLSNAENKNEQKQLPLRFSTSVLSSFSLNKMWSLRRTGVHNIIKQPQFTRRQQKDGRVINTRVRKWCVICSRATKDLTTGKFQKKGFKTNFCCERCMVPLCSPYGKSKRICWDVFHSTKNLCSEPDISLSICLEKANQQTSDASNGDESRTQAEEFSSQRSSPLSTLNLVDTPSRLPQEEKRQREPASRGTRNRRLTNCLQKRKRARK